MKRDRVVLKREYYKTAPSGALVKLIKRKRVSIYYNTRQERKLEINRKQRLYELGEL